MELADLHADLEEESRASMKEWLLKTFKRRECIKYVKCNRYKDKCGCGRRIDEHHYTPENQLNVADNGNIWKIQNHTQLFTTNAFGTLEFQGADTLTTKAEYIRLSFDTKPQYIIKLLKQYWQLELPKLIISVHGGIANFGLQPKLKQAIEKGLVKVADTSKIWIITAGTDTGVVKHIGDIIRNNYPKLHHNIVTFGIAPFGVVSGRDSLIGDGVEVPYFTNQSLNHNSNTVSLNNCHNYFLLVDDGTVGKYGCEISFRRRLERYLSRHKSEICKPKLVDITVEERITLQNHHTIPLVCLVIEGGSNTIQTVLVNVHDKPPVPVVVCDGSGRAADLLAFTHKYAYYSTDKKVTMEIDLKEQLLSTIMKTFAYKKEQAEHLFMELMNCVSNRDLISVYRLGEVEDDIDVAILTASLKIVDVQLAKQLDLMMSWNRPDIAKRYILLLGNSAERNILQEKMFDALSQDKVEFVKLLLEYGVNIQKFLTYKRLQDLYNCQTGPSNTLPLIIKDVVKKFDSNYAITLLDIGLVIEKLMGGGYVSEYSKREFRLKYMRFLEKKYNLNPTEDQDSYVFNYPYNELLIWAVLMKRHKMAMFVCKRGEETMAKALVASKLNKALAREAELDDLDSEIVDEFKRYSDEFANLACGLLDRCYKEDDKLTTQLLTYDLVNWSHWTCMTLAVSGNLKDFLAHTSCQNLISDLWMGGMKIRKYTTYKVITALLFPPAIFAIQFKSVKELQYMPQTQEEHEQDLDDNRSSSTSSSSSISDLHALDNMNFNETNVDDVKGKYNDAYFNYYDNVRQQNANQQNYNNGGITNLEQIIEFYDTQNNLHQRNKHKRKSLNEIDLFATRKLDPQMERKTINFNVRNKSNKLRIGKKLYEFYNAPITKFWQNVIFYILFLISFTYLILVKTPEKPSVLEILVITYIFSYGMDKLRELLQADTPRFSGKLKVFFSKIMNTMDIIFICTIIIAIVFRIINKDTHRFIARLVYCVNTIYWYIKLLEFLVINKYVGPLIIIASRMLVDLFNFVVVILIVLMSFGASRQAIKFPNKDFEWSSVKEIFLEPYFMLYGEVYADKIDPPCTAEDLKNGEPQCQPGHWITPLTMTAFLIVANLLLLTVLIASFNTTYLRISRQSAQVWKCQRYHFVTYYEGKPLFAPPFVVLSHVYMIIKYIIRLCQGKKIKFDRKLKAFLSEDMIQRLHDFEERSFYEYNNELMLSEKNKMEEKVNVTTDRVESISTRIDDIYLKENMTKLSLYKVELRLQKLEDYAYDLFEQLQIFLNSQKSPNFFTQLSVPEVSSNSAAKSTPPSKMLPKVPPNIGLRSNLRRRMHSECQPRVIDMESNLLTNGDEVRMSKRSLNRVSATNNSDTFLPTSNSNKIIDEQVQNPENQTNEPTEHPIFSLDDNNNLADDNGATNEPETAQIDTILSDIESTITTPLVESKSLTENKENNKLQLQHQASSNVDQYTLHPFVYLHPVVKPPLTEYTSITDCIDTSEIDRPPSPLPNNLASSAGAASMANFVNSDDINDYCAKESVRSTIARQESEMLRLAEESQHVIISQMLNKMVKSSNPAKSQPKLQPISDTELSTNNNNNLNNQDDGASNLISDAPTPANDDEMESEMQNTVEPLLCKTNRLLTDRHRNSSQIWFARSEADALCLDLDEDEVAIV